MSDAAAGIEGIRGYCRLLLLHWGLCGKGGGRSLVRCFELEPVLARVIPVISKKIGKKKRRVAP